MARQSKRRPDTSRQDQPSKPAPRQMPPRLTRRPLTPQQVLQLQKTIGNKAVRRQLADVQRNSGGGWGLIVKGEFTVGEDDISFPISALENEGVDPNGDLTYIIDMGPDGRVNPESVTISEDKIALYHYKIDDGNVQYISVQDAAKQQNTGSGGSTSGTQGGADGTHQGGADSAGDASKVTDDGTGDVANTEHTEDPAKSDEKSLLEQEGDATSAEWKKQMIERIKAALEDRGVISILSRPLWKQNIEKLDNLQLNKLHKIVTREDAEAVKKDVDKRGTLEDAVEEFLKNNKPSG